MKKFSPDQAAGKWWNPRTGTSVCKCVCGSEFRLSFITGYRRMGCVTSTVPECLLFYYFPITLHFPCALPSSLPLLPATLLHSFLPSPTLAYHQQLRLEQRQETASQRRTQMSSSHWGMQAGKWHGAACISWSVPVARLLPHLSLEDKESTKERKENLSTLQPC
jgi:hypothetical protein